MLGNAVIVDRVTLKLWDSTGDFLVFVPFAVTEAELVSAVKESVCCCSCCCLPLSSCLHHNAFWSM